MTDDEINNCDRARAANAMYISLVCAASNNDEHDVVDDEQHAGVSWRQKLFRVSRFLFIYLYYLSSFFFFCILEFHKIKT